MFDLILISNEEKIYEGKAKEVKVIIDSVPVSILSQHQPYIAKIEDSVSIKKEGSAVESIKIDKGFLYTNGEKCFVVIDKD
ncbi:MAG: hypothetical protein LBU35_01400 [Holosporales bacterium]|nr:hypothetical protein [Holosporales bacterium]